MINLAGRSGKGGRLEEDSHPLLERVLVSNWLYAVVLTHASTQHSTLASAPPNHTSPGWQQPSPPRVQLWMRWAEPQASPLLPVAVPEIRFCRVNFAPAGPCPLGFWLGFWFGFFFFGVWCYFAGGIAEHCSAKQLCI